MAKAAPSPAEVLDFQFKLQCKLKTFENDSLDVFKKPCNLVSAASRYGLLFIGTASQRFQVIEIQDIQNYTVKEGDVSSYKRRNIPLPSIPKQLSVNCDSTKLCVVVEKDGCIKAVIYDVASFLKQNVSILQEIRLSTTPGVNILDLCWNPSVPSMLVACKDDGTLGLYDVKNNGIEIKELPKTTSATCLCWSPKGKQIVVGSANGKITQYKLDLQVAKVINGPPVNGNPYPISLQWISNYQFVAVYKTNVGDSQMSLMVVDAPKNAEPSYTNYDDICYSYGNARLHQFYMLQQPLWNVILVASSNSMEVGVMRLEKDTWTQWILTDSARAELPLSAIKQDTLPVGMTLDISSNKPIPWGESEVPPAPYLFLLSHQGVLCCFHMINLKEGAPKICAPPESLPDRSGVVYFIAGEQETANPVQAASVTTIVKPTPVAQAVTPIQQFPAFGSGNITAPQTTSTIVAPSFATSQKTQNQTPSLFNKPMMNTPSMFGSFATVKPDSQATTVTKPQIEVKKSESGEKVAITKPVVVTQQQVKQPVTAETKITTPQKVTSGIPAINEETEKLLLQMMKEECANLDLEMKVLLSQGSSSKVDLGNDSEATSIVEGVTVLQDFLKEMNEISTSQAAEIHVLKQNLIQTWVWYEEARSRFATFKDPSLKSILLAQPLDAASERKLDEIRHLIHYLESQLIQANTALDEQWGTFQDSCKRKLSSRIPNIEAVYQVMVKQNATQQKQVYILRDISMRIRSKLRNMNTPRLLMSLDKTGELEEQLKTLHMEPKDLVQLRYEKVFKRQKKLTKIRVDKLKEHFQNANVSHITVRKPQNTSFMQTSGLGVTPFSPIAPKRTEQKLAFVQSTPLVDIVKSSSAVVERNPTPSVVVNLFKQEPKGIGGDVKTSAFVPMVNTKSSLFNQGNLEQTTLFNQQKNQKTATENIAKQSSGSFFGNAPQPGEIVNKSPAASISLIKPSTNEQPQSKANTFTQVPVPNFTFQPSKADSSINLGGFMDKTAFSPTTESDGNKLLFSSIFGQTVKQHDARISNPSVIFGGDYRKPNIPPGLFQKNTVVTTSDNKLFTVEKPTFTFGGNTEQFKASTNTTTPNQSIAITTTLVPSLFSQIFTSSSGQSESNTNIFGQMTPSTTSSVFGFQSNLTTSSNSFFGQGTTTFNIDNKEASVTPVAKPSVISTTAMSTKPVATTNEKGQVLSLGQLTTTGASFGNVTTTTSIFVQPVITTKATGIIKSSSTPSVTQIGINQQSVVTPIVTTTPAIMEPSIPIVTTSTTGTILTVTTSTISPIISLPTSTISPIISLPPSISATPVLTITPVILTTPTVSTVSTITTAPVSTIPIVPPATTSSMFGATQTTSLFGPATTTAIFGQKPFGLTTSTPAFVEPTTTSIFAKAASTFGQQNTTGPATAFVQTPSVFSTPITTATSIFVATTTPFGQSTATSPAFGQTTTSPSMFGQQTTPPSIFGQATSTPTVFGQTILTQSTTPSVFAQTTSTPSVFGKVTLSPVTTTSVFGQTTTTPGIFGPTTSTASVFEQATSTPSVFGQNTSSQSIFGQPTPSAFGQATSTASVFGQPTSTSSIFGQSTSSPSVFGQTPTTSNIFGGSSPTPSSSIFGQPQQSIFAQSTPSVFGQSATAAPVFGQPPAASPSIFGQNTTSTPSVFGQTSFGNNSIFKTSTSSVFGTSSPFGQTPVTTSVFGTSPFASSNTFGANTANNNVFGKPAFGTVDNLNFGSLSAGGAQATTTPTTNAFGFNSFRTTDNSTTNVFESPSTTSSSMFGNSPFSKSTPAFGGPATFGSSPSSFLQPSVFGSTFGSTPSFGSPNEPGPFSAAANNTQPVSQSGFGSPGAFQKPAFAAQPTFGSSPGGFGAPPAFGSSTFGGSPNFGSPNRVFGNAEGFGPQPVTQQQNSTFANLANQQTVGFGSVAQQAPVENMQQPSFAGGSSFTSWR